MVFINISVSMFSRANFPVCSLFFSLANKALRDIARVLATRTRGQHDLFLAANLNKSYWFMLVWFSGLESFIISKRKENASLKRCSFYLAPFSFQVFHFKSRRNYSTLKARKTKSSKFGLGSKAAVEQWQMNLLISFIFWKRKRGENSPKKPLFFMNRHNINCSDSPATESYLLEFIITKPNGQS